MLRLVVEDLKSNSLCLWRCDINKIENELITQQLSGIDLDGDMEYNIDPEIFETKKKQYINMLETFFGGK